MKKYVLVLALGLTMGCATGVLRPYIGEQQAWPTGQGSIVNTKYSLPVFTSLPPTPYDLVGELRIDSFFFAQPEEQHIASLVQIAQKHNADALVLVDGQIFFSVNYGVKGANTGTTVAPTTMAQVNRFNPESFRPGVSILAIKWVGAPPVLPAKFHHLTPTNSVTAPPIPSTEKKVESTIEKKTETPATEPEAKPAAAYPKTTPPPAPPTPVAPPTPAPSDEAR